VLVDPAVHPQAGIVVAGLDEVPDADVAGVRQLSDWSAVDQAELDKLVADVADVAGELGGVGVAAHDQQAGQPGEPVGELVAASVVLHLLERPDPQPPFVGVGGGHGGVAVAQPQRRVAFPLLREAVALFELDRPGPLGEVGEHAAGVDAGELVVITRPHHLRARLLGDA